MDRRKFIGIGSAGFALFALRGLADEGAGGVSFAQISDPQLGMANVDAQGGLSRGVRNTISPLAAIPPNHPLKEFQTRKIEKEIENLNICVDAVNSVKPDFLFITGDMVQRRGDKAQISIFKKLIGRVSKSVKIYYVPGNHDVGGSPESVSAYVREYGYDRFCFSKNGDAFVGVNTEIICSKNDAMRAEHFAWLENAFESVKGAGRIFVFGHRPIFARRIDEKNSYNNFPLGERERHIALFNKHKVCAYHCGHTHKFSIVNCAGCCKQVIVGAVGMPLGVGAASGYYAQNKWIEISVPNPDCSKLEG